MVFPATVHGAREEAPEARQGVLDLTGWDFRSDGSLSLNGEWELYWKALAEPSDFPSSLNSLPEIRYTKVPDFWGQANRGSGAPEREGYATYRLNIMLDPAEEGSIKTLYIRGAATAYKLWVNGKLLAENGLVGTSRETMLPKNYSKTASFSAKGGSNEIVMQISNFVQRKGGLWTPIVFGDEAVVDRQREGNIAVQLFIASALLTLGLYHFALFVLRRRDKLSLLTSCFCLLLSLRSFFLGDTLLVRFYPWISWEWAVRFEYLCPYLGVPTFAYFFYLMYPKETNRMLQRLIVTIGFCFSAGVLFLPPRIFTYSLLPFQLFLIFSVAYMFYLLLLACRRKRTGALLSVIASIALVVTVIHDLLYYNNLIQSFDLAPFGVLLFFFIQTVVVAQKFSKSYYEAEYTSNALAELNLKLEGKIKDRTEALEVANAYLVFANEHLNRVENSRRELIANITHELGTPMTSIQGYMKALLDGVIQPEKKYIQIIYDKIQMAERLVQDLFDLTKLEEGQTTFHMVDVIVEDLFEGHFVPFTWDVENQGVRFELHPPEGPDDLLAIVRIDPVRIRQVMSNLINNALNYTAEGGEISISGYYEHERLILSVTDTGKGIDPAVLPVIFDRFVKGAGPRRNAKDGTGLGLAIAKEIVMHHGGVMTVRSELGKGSTFQFDLPVEFIPMVVD